MFRRKMLAGLLGGAAAISVPASAQAQVSTVGGTRPEVYRVIQPIPTVPNVKITGPDDAPRFYRPCVRIIIPGLQTGDTVIADGMFQVSQPKNYRAMVGRFMKVGETNNAKPPNEDPAYSDYISIPCATNIDRNLHHLPMRLGGSWVCPGPSATGEHQFIITGYSETLDRFQWVPGDSLVLDYGELTLNVFRAV